MTENNRIPYFHFSCILLNGEMSNEGAIFEENLSFSVSIQKLSSIDRCVHIYGKINVSTTTTAYSIMYIRMRIIL